MTEHIRWIDIPYMTALQPTAVNPKAFVPDVITKELGIVRTGGARKIRLSTNFLPLMGFEAGRRHSVEVLPHLEGIRIAFDTDGPQKVYSRQYKSRRNNPFETLIEVGSQSVLDAALPGYTERLHFTMRHGEIFVRPLANRTFSIRRRLAKEADPFNAMVAMTGGIDVRCLMDTGFRIRAVLEFRPQELRDMRDLSETGVLTVLANSRPQYVFNEDISTVDWRRVATTMEGAPQFGVAHISLQCDDYSTAKARSLKLRSEEDLSTSRDLVYDALRMIETINPAVAVIEQVRGFSNSEEGRLLRIKLRKWGYFLSEAVLKGTDFGGLTGRERFYTVASVFPGFEMPRVAGGNPSALWSQIEPYLDGCRDVSNTKALIAGLETGRARMITKDSLFSKVILKSQARGAKDSLRIETPDGRYLMPSLELLQHLQGIPKDFDFSSVSGEQCTEQIGQSIEYPMHEAVCRAVHRHIAENVGNHTVVSIGSARDFKKVAPQAHTQLALFS